MYGKGIKLEGHILLSCKRESQTNLAKKTVPVIIFSSFGFLIFSLKSFVGGEEDALAVKTKGTHDQDYLNVIFLVNYIIARDIISFQTLIK